MSVLPIQSVIPGLRWPSLPGQEGARRLAMMHQLACSERWSAEQLEEAQFRQIEVLLAHADAHVPFWRDRLRRAGLRPGTRLTRAAWSRLPVLTRREAQELGDRLRADATPAAHGGVIDGATSGSTGTPLRFCKTELNAFIGHGFNLRVPLWHGMDFAASRLTIRRLGVGAPDTDIQRLPHWGENYAPFRTGPLARLDVRLPLATHLECILREKPTYLTTLPTNLAALARLCQDSGQRPTGLRTVVAFGETVPDGLRALCRDVLGASLLEVYSAEETGPTAIQCPEHEHLHVMAEGCRLEVLDDDDRPCGPGGRGRVVVTMLQNFAMPLLRYEIGDLAEVGSPCSCGRGLPVLARVLGRIRDRVLMPNGESRAPYLGRERLYRIPAIIQHQFAQVARDIMEIRLVARRKLTAEEEALLTEEVRDNLGYPFHVKFVYQDAIPREPSGKYKDVVSELEDAPDRSN